MCKEMPVIPVDKVVDPKRIFGKKWRAEEEERHKGLLTPKKVLGHICNSALPIRINIETSFNSTVNNE
jgi:hypothetical protein